MWRNPLRQAPSSLCLTARQPTSSINTEVGASRLAVHPVFMHLPAARHQIGEDACLCLTAARISGIRAWKRVWGYLRQIEGSSGGSGGVSLCVCGHLACG